MLRYPVKLTPDDNGTLLVTAPDFPEVATFGKNEADALSRASDAIATAIQGRISDRQLFPLLRGHARHSARQHCLPSHGRSLNSTGQCSNQALERPNLRAGSVFIRRRSIVCSISTITRGLTRSRRPPASWDGNFTSRCGRRRELLRCLGGLVLIGGARPQQLLLLQLLGDEESELERLGGIEARIAEGVVAVVEILIR